MRFNDTITGFEIQYLQQHGVATNVMGEITETTTHCSISSSHILIIQKPDKFESYLLALNLSESKI